MNLHCGQPHFKETIQLDGSKSISNRLLVINALSGCTGQLHNLSTSDDTIVLEKALNRTIDIAEEMVYDVGHAGTSFRFLTAYLSIQKGTQILTGSDRMKERPIGPLVNALNELGAHITYVDRVGYPPLRIQNPEQNWKREIAIDASISSQFISALLLIAPALKDGLTIYLKGKQVSTPYIKMTTSIMESCAASVKWIREEQGDAITVQTGNYQLEEYIVEADWSAASYYYSIAAFSTHCDIRLNGLFEDSLQSDQAIASIGAKLGIETHYGKDGITLIKTNNIRPDLLEYDFSDSPDIAQTVMVIVAGLGLHGLYTGLETLKIKETDRITAMKVELEKLAVVLMRLPDRFSKTTENTYYMSEGKAFVEGVPVFDTYHDHRMAMSLAPLAILFDIRINDPEVVSKSYPDFWKDMRSLGIE